MSQGGQHNGEVRLGLGRTLGVAAVAGLTAGALYALEDVLRACKAYGWWRASDAGGPAPILAMAAVAVAWYAAAGCAVAVLAGLGAWTLVRLHGYRFDTARAAALCAGGFLCVGLPPLLKGLITPDLAILTLLSSIGFGCAAYAAARWSGALARLAAGAAGFVAAMFVLVCWLLWLAELKPLAGASWKGKLSQAAVLALAAALGVAIYRLSLALLRRKAGMTNDGMTNDESMPNAECRTEGRAAAGSASAIRHSSFRHSSLALPRHSPFVIWLLVALACLVALAGGTWAIAPARPRLARSADPVRRPNIVWLLLDTARADAFSCYRNPRPTSPCIDQLAAESVLYERAFAQAGWTLPSHASMFTGLLPSRHGATGEQFTLRDDCTTIAEVLRNAGYSTFLCSANLHVSPRFNTAQGFERQFIIPWGRGPEYPLLLAQAMRGLHLTDDGARSINSVAMRWTREAHDARRPFFLFINYHEVHRDYGSTPYLARWLPRGVSVKRACSISQSLEAHVAGTVSPARKDFGILRALYEGDLTYLDERIGELVGHLRRLGTLDDTLLIVTSDHGEELGEHGPIGHVVGLRNTLLHVPLLVRYPARFPPGTRRQDLAELIDLFPTILDVAGVAWDGRQGLQGRSLLAHPPPERFAVAQRDIFTTFLADMIRDHPTWNTAPLMRRFMSIQDRSIQDRRFKYVWASDDTAELFDLTADPLEHRNVLDRFPQEAARLRAALEARVGRLRPGLSAAALAQAERENPPKAP